VVTIEKLKRWKKRIFGQECFCQKSKFRAKTQISAQNKNCRINPTFVVKNQNFLVKNINFAQTLKFL